MLPAGLVSAHDAADLLTVLVLDDRVAAAARVAADAALPEGRVRDARGDVGRAAKSACVKPGQKMRHERSMPNFFTSVIAFCDNILNSHIKSDRIQ